MAGYWLKLYTEILDDKKYYQLSDNAKLAMYELMLIAKRNDSDEIPSIDDICFMTHNARAKEWWESAIKELMTIKFIAPSAAAQIIRKWQDRQKPVPVTERSKQYREKKHEEEYYGNDNATTMQRNVTEIEREIKKEKEEEREDSSPSFSKEEEKIWNHAIGNLLSNGMSKADYETWVKPLELTRVRDGTFTITAKNKYARDWVVSRCATSLISELYITVGPQAKIEIIV